MAIFLDFAFLIIGLALNPDPHNHFFLVSHWIYRTNLDSLSSNTAQVYYTHIMASAFREPVLWEGRLALSIWKYLKVDFVTFYSSVSRTSFTQIQYYPSMN